MEKEELDQFIADVNFKSIVNLSLMVGHKLGLFDVLCETDQPMSAQEIADKAKLKERYTKEWLSSLVAARIIQQDRETGLYVVPESYRKDLKMKLSFGVGIRAWADRSELVQNCFRQGGPYGFVYDEDPTWYDWFHDFRNAVVDPTLDQELIPLIKEAGMIPKLESGIAVVDIGCGSGCYINGLAKRFPKSHFTGVEISEKALGLALEVAEKEHLTNVTFMKGDAHELPRSWPEKFDWVIINDTLHDLPNPNKALKEMYTVMKDDGALGVLEMGYHSNPVDNAGNMAAAMMYTLSLFNCLPCSMNDPPHVGYGACWGVEEVEKAIKKAKFEIKSQTLFNSIHGQSAFFHCTK